MEDKNDQFPPNKCGLNYSHLPCLVFNFGSQQVLFCCEAAPILNSKATGSPPSPPPPYKCRDIWTGSSPRGRPRRAKWGPSPSPLAHTHPLARRTICCLHPSQTRPPDTGRTAARRPAPGPRTSAQCVPAIAHPALPPHPGEHGPAPAPVHTQTPAAAPAPVPGPAPRAPLPHPRPGPEPAPRAPAGTHYPGGHRAGRVPPFAAVTPPSSSCDSGPQDRKHSRLQQSTMAAAPVPDPAQNQQPPLSAPPFLSPPHPLLGPAGFSREWRRCGAPRAAGLARRAPPRGGALTSATVEGLPRGGSGPGKRPRRWRGGRRAGGRRGGRGCCRRRCQTGARGPDPRVAIVARPAPRTPDAGLPAGSGPRGHASGPLVVTPPGCFFPRVLVVGTNPIHRNSQLGSEGEFDEILGCEGWDEIPRDARRWERQERPGSRERASERASSPDSGVAGPGARPPCRRRCLPSPVAESLCCAGWKLGCRSGSRAEFGEAGADPCGPGRGGLRSRENVNFTPGPERDRGLVGPRAALGPARSRQSTSFVPAATGPRAAVLPRPRPALGSPPTVLLRRKHHRHHHNHPLQPPSGSVAMWVPSRAYPLPPRRGTSHLSPAPVRLPLPSFASAPPASRADGLRLSHPSGASPPGPARGARGWEPRGQAVGVGPMDRRGAATCEVCPVAGAGHPRGSLCGSGSPATRLGLRRPASPPRRALCSSPPSAGSLPPFAFPAPPNYFHEPHDRNLVARGRAGPAAGGFSPPSPCIYLLCVVPSRAKQLQSVVELFKFIPLCILQYPPFFPCPLNNKRFAILGNFIPKSPFTFLREGKKPSKGEKCVWIKFKV
ncbi:basic proline-rich protein-like [Dipodomys spectabilis]|uniref:basic proline-rich protein-like n=1 Tax=Dipodomys spectabilis TaxID=105255 RepID=UPI001C54A8F9|nr:basic proline-rich protein-like [Dipodomys spectabilis]